MFIEELEESSDQSLISDITKSEMKSEDIKAQFSL